MGLLSLRPSTRVTFSLPGKEAERQTQEALEAEASSSVDSGSGNSDAALAPATPHGGAPVSTGAAAAASTRYWPSEQEVEAVLALLSEGDRQQCDAAMANRCGLGMRRLGRGPGSGSCSACVSPMR